MNPSHLTLVPHLHLYSSLCNSNISTRKHNGRDGGLGNPSTARKLELVLQLHPRRCHESRLPIGRLRFKLRLHPLSPYARTTPPPSSGVVEKRARSTIYLAPFCSSAHLTALSGLICHCGVHKTRAARSWLTSCSHRALTDHQPDPQLPPLKSKPPDLSSSLLEPSLEHHHAYILSHIPYPFSSRFSHL